MATPEVIGNAQEGEGDAQARQGGGSVKVPKAVRQAYAAKIWALLFAQNFSVFVIIMVFELAGVPQQRRTAPFVFAAAIAVNVFGGLALIRNWYPFNQMLFAISIPVVGVFWGSINWYIQGMFATKLYAIIVLSSIFSAAWSLSGLVDSTGWFLRPRIGRFRFTASSSSSAETTGVARATLILGMLSWGLASGITLVIFIIVAKVNPAMDPLSVHRYQTIAAIAFGLMFECFRHCSVARDLTKCDPDNSMKAAIDVNLAIFLFWGSCMLCPLICCSDGHVGDMAADGGVMGVGPDIGGGGEEKQQEPDLNRA